MGIGRTLPGARAVRPPIAPLLNGVEAMNLHQRLLARARACGAAALRPIVREPSSPWLPVGVYGTAALAFLLWNLFAESTPAWAWIVLPASGLLFWSLLEYVLHSQFFHDPPPRYHWLSRSHTEHHDAPDNPNHIVVRLAFSLPVAVVLFAVVSLALWSVRLAALVQVGMIAGYLSYEVIHYSIHMVPVVRRLLRPLASHHLHHHYADPTRCYGVTSPLWDWVFRTDRRRRAAGDLGLATPVAPAPGAEAGSLLPHR